MEEYFFGDDFGWFSEEEEPPVEEKKVFVLIIYDIIDNTVPMSDLENMEAEHTGDLAGAFCRATRELPDISDTLKEKMTMYGLEAMARTGER